MQVESVHNVTLKYAYCCKTFLDFYKISELYKLSTWLNKNYEEFDHETEIFMNKCSNMNAISDEEKMSELFQRSFGNIHRFYI